MWKKHHDNVFGLTFSQLKRIYHIMPKLWLFRRVSKTWTLRNSRIKSEKMYVLALRALEFGYMIESWTVFSSWHNVIKSKRIKRLSVNVKLAKVVRAVKMDTINPSYSCFPATKTRNNLTFYLFPKHSYEETPASKSGSQLDMICW